MHTHTIVMYIIAGVFFFGGLSVLIWWTILRRKTPATLRDVGITLVSVIFTIIGTVVGVVAFVGDKQELIIENQKVMIRNQKTLIDGQKELQNQHIRIIEKLERK